MKTTFVRFKMMTSLLMVLLTAISLNGYSFVSFSEIKLTKISKLQNYSDQYIKGEVVRILDEDEFRLEDESGKIKVYTGWQNTNLVRKGEIVTVRGSLDPGIIKEFYATELIREMVSI